MVPAGEEEGSAAANVTAAALVHALHQESVMFNPHLHPVGGNQWVVFGVLMPAFGLLSLVLNFFTFVTLSHRNQTRGSSPLSLLLQCLSAYDACVAALSLAVYSAPTVAAAVAAPGDAEYYLRRLHPAMVPYLYSLLHMAITGSDYLNLAAAVERYIALDGPFRQRKEGASNGCTPASTWFYIAGILAGTVCFNLPIMWERTAVESGDHLEVVHTELRLHAIYIKLYRLTMEFLVFKATPFFSFFILFVSLKDRIRFYQSKKVRKTLSVSQYLEVLDSRIILGINGLFYVTNCLPLYVSVCHIVLRDVSDDLTRVAYLCIVVNSTFKFFVYLALSHDFRKSLRHLFLGDDWHWMAEEEHSHSFLGHAKVASFVQADPAVAGGRNKCRTYSDTE